MVAKLNRKYIEAYSLWNQRADLEMTDWSALEYKQDGFVQDPMANLNHSLVSLNGMIPSVGYYR